MRIVSRTRDEAKADLTNLADGWAHLCNPPRWAEAFNALGAVLHGATEVTVGHMTYRITSDGAPARTSGQDLMRPPGRGT